MTIRARGHARVFRCADDDDDDDDGAGEADDDTFNDTRARVNIRTQETVRAREWACAREWWGGSGCIAR